MQPLFEPTVTQAVWSVAIFLGIFAFVYWLRQRENNPDLIRKKADRVASRDVVSDRVVFAVNKAYEESMVTEEIRQEFFSIMRRAGYKAPKDTTTHWYSAVYQRIRHPLGGDKPKAVTEVKKEVRKPKQKMSSLLVAKR